MIRSSLRIAVLEAGYPAVGTAAMYGSYGGLFISFLRAGAEKLDIHEFSAVEALVITKWDVHNTENYPTLDSVDAILITGSRSSPLPAFWALYTDYVRSCTESNAFDNTPWIVKLVEFTRSILLEQTRVRMIGICFGHQIIGRALGAKVDQNEHGWEASVVSVELSPKGKGIFGKNTLNIHQMHKDILTELPEGTVLLGSTNVCKIQGMYDPMRLFTLQGHPEFTSEITRELLLLRKNIRIIPETVFEEMMTRADNEHDGLDVAAAFLRFLNE